MLAAIYDHSVQILTLLTPFILMYLTWRGHKKEKEDEKYRKVCEENRTLQDQINKAKDEKNEQCVSELRADVNTLKEEMTKVNNNISKISDEVSTKVTETLSDLLTLNSVNLAYCQSLSTLITTIGEGLRDESKDKSISDAIKNHQEKERELFASVFKSAC